MQNAQVNTCSLNITSYWNFPCLDRKQNLERKAQLSPVLRYPRTTFPSTDGSRAKSNRVDSNDGSNPSILAQVEAETANLTCWFDRLSNDFSVCDTHGGEGGGF